jgi:hypothetical protein
MATVYPGLGTEIEGTARRDEPRSGVDAHVRLLLLNVVKGYFILFYFASFLSVLLMLAKS